MLPLQESGEWKGEEWEGIPSTEKSMCKGCQDYNVLRE